DHRIPRTPDPSPERLPDKNANRKDVRLVPFPDSPDAENDIRDLALAWEEFTDSGAENFRSKAEELLRRSVAEFPKDARSLAALGYDEQVRGNLAEARKMYERALASDPDLIDAATNLGVIEAERGNINGAIKLLQGAFERAPANSSVGMNLARVYCVAGEPEQARTSTVRILEFNPDLRAAKEFLEELNRSGSNCGAIDKH
ncbi:MAG: tetratricopeptide repeat protein, partial [Acidobacteria bacterium]|nr:tetratricopeptide repeat protein [Acidobacteriota bacterium]